MRKKIIVYGDLNIDMFVKTASFPRPGEDALVESLNFFPGGSAASCAAIAAKLGAQVEFLGLLGNDSFAEQLLADLHQHGVNTTYLRRIDAPSGVVIVLNEAKTGERAFFSYRGANGTVPYGDIPEGLFNEGDILHVTGYSFETEASRKTAQQLMFAAFKANAGTSIDPSFEFARRWQAESDAMFGRATYLFPNWTEAQLMTRAETPKEAAIIFRNRFIASAIITLGANGCYIDSIFGNTQAEVSPYPQDEVVDTTGAGDAFCGGFLAARVLNYDLPLTEAAMVGHAAAGEVIRHRGGRTGAPSLTELIRIAEARGDGILLKALHSMQVQS